MTTSTVPCKHIASGQAKDYWHRAVLDLRRVCWFGGGQYHVYVATAAREEDLEAAIVALVEERGATNYWLED